MCVFPQNTRERWAKEPDECEEEELEEILVNDNKKHSSNGEKKGKYISINAHYSAKVERNRWECEIGYEGHIMMEKLSTVTLYLVHSLKPVTILKWDTLCFEKNGTH